VIASRRPNTLRAKLTLWSTVAMIFGLVAYATIVYISLRRVLWGEIDERLHHEIETVEGLLAPYWTPDGVNTPGGASPLDGDDDRWLQVWSRDGRLLFQSDVAKELPMAALAAPGADAALSLDNGKGVSVRVKDEQGHIGDHPITMRVITSEAPLRQELTAMLWLMALALPLSGAAVAYGGSRLVRHALAPVDRLVASAKAITADRLGDRLPVENAQDEVGQIAQAFNATLARLEASFEQMRRFTANASHELRTPITALRSVGQVALATARDPAAYREAIGSMLDEADHLARLLETMLLLAKSDAGQIALTRQLLNLGELTGLVADQCLVLAEEKRQTLSVDPGREPALVSADPVVLRIAIANLIHNAIRYANPASEISLRVFARDDEAVLEVEDRGPGIPAEHHGRLFDRFYRVDGARSHGVGGAGLGLAMARWAVEVHGGAIGVHSRPGMGSTFHISLPASSQGD
jgi:heavy metal sensor kinase